MAKSKVAPKQMLLVKKQSKRDNSESISLNDKESKKKTKTEQKVGKLELSEKKPEIEKIEDLKSKDETKKRKRKNSNPEIGDDNSKGDVIKISKVVPFDSSQDESTRKKTKTKDKKSKSKSQRKKKQRDSEDN